ncbi:MAG: sigma-70 family RNA polymerase sigma factor [Candidatus Sericytochromatia bacterium]|nr:sigma-70 family RNA polymerase sigma factor [Candidatus Sericytochromatia bacterium]
MSAPTKKATEWAAPKNDSETVTRYLPLVRSIARRISTKLPRHYDLDDLVSDGIVGLLAAIDRFDPTRGVKFETFATYYVKGAILDNLPKLPTMPGQKKGSMPPPPTEEENAANATAGEEGGGGDDVKAEAATLYSKVTQLSYSYILSLDAPTGSDGDEGFNLLSQLGGMDAVQNDMEFNELQGTLRLAIEQLPVQERTTLKYYYFQQMPFNEIGKKLGLSESWVSRIHKRALEQLRMKLGRRKSVDDFIS